MRHRIPVFTIVAYISLLSPIALADNTPIVHGIPNVPLSAARVSGTFKIVLDAAPPASTQFYFDVPVGDANAVGVLSVWPLAEDPAGTEDCTNPPQRGHQTYQLGMGTVKEGDASYLRATVPPLQVRQQFCFSVRSSIVPSTTEMTVIATNIAHRIWTSVTQPKASCDLGTGDFSGWLADELGLGGGAAGPLQTAAILAVATYNANVLNNCTDYQVAEDVHRQTQKTLADMKKDDSNFSTASAAEQKSKAAADSASKIFKTALLSMFNDSLRNAIVITQSSMRLQSDAGAGTTPSAANYGSVDAGVFLSIPSGGAQSDVWLVPYLGLNLYSVPVDRTIDLRDLTGTFWNQVRQRVSLTIGITLSTPSIAGRTLSAPLLSHYPIAALGVRLTNYTRVTAGAVFYKIGDANPASAATSLTVAPFVGAALDVDIIHLLTQAKL